MTLVALPGKIIPRVDHTLIVMDDGKTRHAVCIQGGSHCPADLIAHMGEIERIASLKVERGELAFDGRVWMLADEVFSGVRYSH